MPQKLTGELSTTFREFILLPRCTKSEHGLAQVSLQTRLTHDLKLNIPFMSSAMESVTGDRIAIALAQRGGMAVLPAGNVSAELQLDYLKATKRFKAGFVEKVITVADDDPIRKVIELERQHKYSTFPVVDSKGRLAGLITEKKYNPWTDGELLVRERMLPLDRLVVGRHGMTLSEANKLIFESGIGVLPVVDEGGLLKSVVFFSDIRRHHEYPESVVDSQKRLRVAGAVSTHPEDLERARALVAEGADVIVIDASDGYSEFMGTTIKELKKLGVPVVAGNVVDAAGFDYLVENGADAIKVGIGSGSICTTRRVKSIGRGQATAVHQVAMARDRHQASTGRYIPVISDGGIESSGDMSVALALGADVLMMGKYFAGFEESPTNSFMKRLPVLFSGQMAEVEVTVKPYWGEASPRAKNVRRYGQNDPRSFVIEGEEGYVLYKGSIHNGLPRDLMAIKGTVSSCGCDNLADFYQQVEVERQTLESVREGGTSIFRF